MCTVNVTLPMSPRGRFPFPGPREMLSGIQAPGTGRGTAAAAAAPGIMSETATDLVVPFQTFKKRRDSTLAEKVKILELLQQPKASQSISGQEHGLSQSTISRVMKKRDEILERWYQNENPSRKRNRPFKHAKVDEALLEWLLFAKANKLPISGPILMRRAEAIAKEVGCPQFKPSNGWLWRWKERYRIFFRGYADRTEVLPGEKRHSSTVQAQCVNILPDVPQLVRMELNNAAAKDFAGRSVNTDERVRRREGGKIHTQSQLDARSSPAEGGSRHLLLAQLTKNYCADDIFYAVETPFQFRIIAGQGEIAGQQKEAVCIWFCCNLNGTEKLKLLVTHNLSPKSLGMHTLSPVSLKTSEDGFLTEGVFTDWLLNWDGKLARQDRKVLLAFTAHSCAPKVKLRSISLCIFSKDKTSSSPVFGQELVNEFNAYYRQLLLERLQEGTNINRGAGLSYRRQLSLSLVEASYTMNKAWQRVTPQTIMGCFQKTEGDPILRSAKQEPLNVIHNEDIRSFTLQSEMGNRPTSTPFSAGSGVYKRITIKEEGDVEQEEFGWDATKANSSGHIQKVTIGSLTSEADMDMSSAGCLMGQAKLGCSEPYPVPKDGEKISTVVLKSEDPGRYRQVQELQAACDIIQSYLVTRGQDMSTFCALQNQLERCITRQNKEQHNHHMLKN